MKGKLFIVPTPIGNLEDITLRAISVLNQVDVILAEDTRKSGILLKKHKIEKRLHSHHKFNEHKAIPHLLERMELGEHMALVSDAGTPGISDPGFLLVRSCIEKNIEVECLPGPTALIPALVNSGLPCESFCFEGFLPLKKGRQTKLSQLATEKRTMVFYESPHRLLRTLDQLIAVMGPERQASISRELSKIHEETRRGTLEELVAHYKEGSIKGEIVIVVAGFSDK
jgi:16S rRNA (cytidine1402-2'-O)-methyltransferase